MEVKIISYDNSQSLVPAMDNQGTKMALDKDPLPRAFNGGKDIKGRIRHVSAELAGACK